MTIDNQLNQEEQQFILDLRIIALDKAMQVHNVGFQSDDVHVEKIIETAKKLEGYLKNAPV